MIEKKALHDHTPKAGLPAFFWIPMRQTIGIRFSEHGQVHICSYHVPEEGPLLAPASGIMTKGEHGLTFGRVVWQHLESTETELRKAKETEEIAQYSDTSFDFSGKPFSLSTTDASTLVASSLDDIAGEMPDGAPDQPIAPGSDTDASDFTSANPPADCNQSDKNENGESPSGKKEGRRLLAKPMPELRLATETELVAAMENERVSREAHHYCRRCIAERNLDMKLVDVETLYDHSKMIFYFTAPTRIDFRELVKDLVRQYRTRIELRQIGVRHETQMVGALGNCGMVCCCRRYLKKFAPVTIKMAKEQNLFLNPAKISGICGRLLCCLSYEQENYDSFHRSCPRLGKRYQTMNGPMRVLRGNMFRNSVVVLPDGGQELEITLEEWKDLNPQRSESTARDSFGDDAGGNASHDAHGGNFAGNADGLDSDLAELEEDAPTGHGGARRDARRPSRPVAPARQAPRIFSKDNADRKEFSGASEKKIVRSPAPKVPSDDKEANKRSQSRKPDEENVDSHEFSKD